MRAEEATNTNDLEIMDGPVIGVVCDHCQANYAVSATCFAQSYRHKFSCSSCGNDWIEYLDDDVHTNLLQVLTQAQSPKTDDVKDSSDDEHIDDAPSLEEGADSDDTLDSMDDDDLLEELEDSIETGEIDDFEEGAIETDSEGLDEENPDATDEGKSGITDQKAATPASTKKTEKNEIQNKNKILQKISINSINNLNLVPLGIVAAIIVTLFVGSGAYFYLNRHEIITKNPISVAAYQYLGIRISPVEGLDVEIEDITRESTIILGEETRFDFKILAKVRNISDIEKRLPFLRVNLQNSNNDLISFWDVNLTGRVLTPGQDMDITIPYPPQFIGNKRVETIELRLLSREEREILGVNRDIETVEISN